MFAFDKFQVHRLLFCRNHRNKVAEHQFSIIGVNVENLEVILLQVSVQ